jgi:cobalt-zinc-cadmium efflux system outer membrane protein
MSRNRLAMVAASWMLWVSLAGLTPAVPAQEGRREPGSVLLELPNLGPVPGAFESSLGPGPGALSASAFGVPAPAIVGARRRTGGILPKSSAKVHPTGAGPGSAPPFATADNARPRLPFSSGPGAGPGETPLTLGAVSDDPGPPDGLTLDAAIERMMAANLDLNSLKYELPQADADVLTAGLRTNPIVYMDTQFIPYGAYSMQRPLGPIQYDINITYPIDLSHKRPARVRVARSAKRVLEAQYQDVVRRQIGNLYRAFVDLQAARNTYLMAAAAVREQERVVARELRAAAKGARTAGIERLQTELDKARSGIDDARDARDDAREALGLLLSLPAEQAACIEPRGSLRDLGPPAPPLDELKRLALEDRPDLVATRLGLGRAEAEVRLARANRLDDVFLFYDPITYQDNRAARLPSGRSWDIGLAIPLPIYNRNQGNIARALGNLSQTQAELAALERRIVSEVRQAHREYHSSGAALARFERSILPRARDARAKADAEFAARTMSPDDYLGQLNDDEETARLYRDAFVRHRRSMLDLNTAIGFRLLP